MVINVQYFLPQGRMLFDDSGSRVQIKVTVRQYRKSNGE